jgi:hypothetical protein
MFEDAFCKALSHSVYLYVCLLTLLVLSFFMFYVGVCYFLSLFFLSFYLSISLSFYLSLSHLTFFLFSSYLYLHPVILTLSRDELVFVFSKFVLIFSDENNNFDICQRVVITFSVSYFCRSLTRKHSSNHLLESFSTIFRTFVIKLHSEICV